MKLLYKLPLIIGLGLAGAFPNYAIEKDCKITEEKYMAKSYIKRGLKENEQKHILRGLMIELHPEFINPESELGKRLTNRGFYIEGNSKGFHLYNDMMNPIVQVENLESDKIEPPKFKVLENNLSGPETIKEHLRNHRKGKRLNELLNCLK